MRRLLALAGLLVALPAAATGAALELSAAWHGFSRPGRLTELTIRLEAPTDGSAEVEVGAGARRIVTSLGLKAGVADEVRLPVPALDALAVRVRLADGTALERVFRPSLAERPLIAASVPLALPDDQAVLPVDAGALPGQPDGYAAVDALVIDGATLALLSPPQLLALLADVARCGRVIAVGLDGATADVLQRSAGCSGRALARVARAAEVPAALEALFGQALPAAPGAQALQTVLPARRSSDWTLVVGALAIYLVLAVLAALFAPAPLAAGVALAAAALVLAVSRLAPSGNRLGIWAEVAAGDRAASYAALEAVAGRGRRPVEIALPAELAGATPCREDEPSARWTWDARRQRFAAVAFDARLFEERAVCFHGDFPTLRNAAFEPAAGGGLRVLNTGPGPWPAGTAFANGLVYRLPAMSTGQWLDLAPAAARAPRQPTERLAVDRAAAGLLWPLELSALGRTDVRAAASLLLRSGGGVAR